MGTIDEKLFSESGHIPKATRNTYYVDATNGHDNYSGLYPTEKMATIGAAITAWSAGDRIIISEDTYAETISIPAGDAGCEIICEPGVILTGNAATVVSIAAPNFKWVGGTIRLAGQIGMAVTGADFKGKDIVVDACTVGFDLDAVDYELRNCHARNVTTTGFDIANADGVLKDCTAAGAGAARGFYYSHTNAHQNIAVNCHSLNCTAGGWDYVAGADSNLNAFCSQSSLCGGPADAGANNSFASFSLESQITGGQSLQSDINSIYTRIGAPAGASIAADLVVIDNFVDGLEASIARTLYTMDFWSAPQEAVIVTGGASDLSLPTVTVAELPAGATIVRAQCMFMFRMVENTYAGVNKLSGAQEIQIRDDTPGAWTDAINFVDDLFTLAASTREGGTVIMGNIDVAATVDANDGYNFQWDEAVADQANIEFNDVQVGIRIWYSI